MSTNIEQQPIGRTVGKRQTREGRPLSEADRAAMSSNARYITRAPKGVFIYRNHEEMDADRLRWLVDAMVQSHR